MSVLTRAPRPGRWRTRGGASLRRRRMPYLLTAPTVVLLVSVFVVAMLTLGEFSLHRFENGVSSPDRTLSEWTTFLTDSFQGQLVLASVQLGVVVMLCCLVLGYLTAYAIHRTGRGWVRSVAYFALFAPLLTSVVARAYGWTLVLGDTGMVNSVLSGVGLGPWALLYNMRAVVIASTHILLPFAVFPILSSLRQIDDELADAAADLGARPRRTFLRVTLPLSLPGVVGAAQLCFGLAVSSFATPSLLGGGRVQVLATAMYEDVQNLNWPRAAVAAYVLLAIALAAFLLLALLQRRVLPMRRES